MKIMGRRNKYNSDAERKLARNNAAKQKRREKGIFPKKSKYNSIEERKAIENEKAKLRLAKKRREQGIKPRKKYNSEEERKEGQRLYQIEYNRKKVTKKRDTYNSDRTKKRCYKCKEEKTLDNFCRNKQAKDGLNCKCKTCCNKANNNFKKLNPDYSKIYRENNIEKEKKRNDEYYKNNVEKILERCSNHRKNNLEYYTNYSREYLKKNPHIKASRNILRDSLRRLGKKKEGHTIDLLGYSALQLKEHLEKQFTPLMTWDNYGEWHVDHIKRVSEFDKETPMNVVNALSNLRPLWATSRTINGIFYEGNLNRG